MYFPIIFPFIRSRRVIESGRIWTGANAVKRWPSVLTPAFWCCLFATQTADSHSFAAAGHFFIFFSTIFYSNVIHYPYIPHFWKLMHLSYLTLCWYCGFSFLKWFPVQKIVYCNLSFCFHFLWFPVVLLKIKSFWWDLLFFVEKFFC